MSKIHINFDPDIPPTRKQQEYAENIAHFAHVRCPKFKRVKECNDFIDKHLLAAVANYRMCCVFGLDMLEEVEGWDEDFERGWD